MVAAIEAAPDARGVFNTLDSFDHLVDAVVDYDVIDAYFVSDITSCTGINRDYTAYGEKRGINQQ